MAQTEANNTIKIAGNRLIIVSPNIKFGLIFFDIPTAKDWHVSKDGNSSSSIVANMRQDLSQHWIYNNGTLPGSKRLFYGDGSTTSQFNWGPRSKREPILFNQMDSSPQSLFLDMGYDKNVIDWLNRCHRALEGIINEKTERSNCEAKC